MPQLAAIFRALLTALRRGARSLGSFSGNNLFLASIVLLFFSDSGGFVAINAVIALIVFFPLSSDPLRKIPPVRLALWPITGGQRVLLRFAATWLNPAAGLLIGLAVWRRVTLGVLALIGAMAIAAVSAPSINPSRRALLPLPHFPTRFNQLLRKDLRQLFCTLDFAAALLLAIPCAIARISGALPSEGALQLTICITIALSSYAQTLFGLDRAGDFTRYRLLPIEPWKILAARDAAFLLAGLALTVTLAPLAGLAALLAALILGRRSSLIIRTEQTRWRFSMSQSFSGGLIQMAAMIFAACATALFSPLVLAPILAVYAFRFRYYNAGIL